MYSWTLNYKKLDLREDVCKLEDVEKLLLVWIKEKQLPDNTVTENYMCEKTKVLNVDLVNRLPSTLTENEEAFKATMVS